MNIQTYSVAVLYSEGECIKHMDFIIEWFNDLEKKQLVTV